MNDVLKFEDKLLGECYYKIKHNSGLDVYVYPKDFSSTFAVFGTKYGSIDNVFKLKGEKDYISVPNGIAHFLEHKLFDNETGEDTFTRYSNVGADANAFTSFDKTAYLFSCTENFDKALEILLDFVTSPYFTEKTVRKEQGIIGQEIKMCEDNPGRELFFGLMDCLYSVNPVKINIAGTVESISEITSDLLYKCYNTFYNLGNMVLCVCGNVTKEQVLKVCDKVLYKSETQEIERFYPNEPKEVNKKIFTKKMQVSKPLFNIGVKDIDIPETPAERMKKCAGMSVLNEILFSKSSAFFNDLYKNGYISVGLDFDYSVTSTFAFNELSCESDKPFEVFEKFKKYIDETKKSGVSESDFERCRKVLISEHILSFDYTEEIASNLMDFAFDGFDIYKYSDILKSLDKEYIDKLLNDVFREECFAVSVIEPID